MSRPAHIAPLDEALDRHIAELVEAERRQVEVVAKYEEFLRLHAAELSTVEDATKARMNAYYAAKSCEKAIRKLGFVVLNGGRTVAKGTSRLDGHPGNFREPVTFTREADMTDDEGAR